MAVAKCLSLSNPTNLTITQPSSKSMTTKVVLTTTRSRWTGDENLVARGSETRRMLRGPRILQVEPKPSGQESHSKPNGKPQRVTVKPRRWRFQNATAKARERPMADKIKTGTILIEEDTFLPESLRVTPPSRKRVELSARIVDQFLQLSGIVSPRLIRHGQRKRGKPLLSAVRIGQGFQSVWTLPCN